MNHYSPLTSWHQGANRLTAGNTCSRRKTQGPVISRKCTLACMCMCVCVCTDAADGVSVYGSVCLSHFLHVEIRGRRRAELSDSWKWDLSMGLDSSALPFHPFFHSPSVPLSDRLLLPLLLCRPSLKYVLALYPFHRSLHLHFRPPAHFPSFIYPSISSCLHLPNKVGPCLIFFIFCALSYIKQSSKAAICDVVYIYLNPSIHPFC